jgi:cytochrome c oxidase assembly factor CtaG
MKNEKAGIAKILVICLTFIAFAANALYNESESWNIGYLAFICLGCGAIVLALIYGLKFNDHELIGVTFLLTILFSLYGFATIPVKGISPIFVPITLFILFMEGAICLIWKVKKNKNPARKTS